jgi:hypothetical protein
MMILSSPIALKHRYRVACAYVASSIAAGVAFRNLLAIRFLLGNSPSLKWCYSVDWRVISEVEVEGKIKAN